MGAFLGSQEQAATQIGETLINAQGGIRGRPVRFVFHDDQSKPQVSVQLLQQILPEKPSIVLGAATVADCRCGDANHGGRPGDVLPIAVDPPGPGQLDLQSNVSTDDANRANIRFFRLRVGENPALGKSARPILRSALSIGMGAADYRPRDQRKSAIQPTERRFRRSLEHSRHPAARQRTDLFDPFGVT